MSARIPQPNNFDHIRLVFALMVLGAHLPVLSGVKALAWMNHCFNAGLAVDGFFIVSGCLVAASFERSRSLKLYFEKRLRRIYPGYVMIILGSVLLGACITHTQAYWQHAGTWRYLAANLFFAGFLAPTLPGVFNGNPITAVNGPLWTIKVEVAFYLLLPLFALLQRRAGTLPVLAVIYVLSYAYWLALSPQHAELAHQLPGQLRYFAVGMALFYFNDAWRMRATQWFVPAAAVVVTRCLFTENVLLEAVHPLALGVLVSWLAWRVPHPGNLMRLGDISYGVYILHFPVIQLAVQMGWMNAHPLSGATLTATAIIALAVALWHGVEKPALKSDSHYRQDRKEVHA